MKLEKVIAERASKKVYKDGDLVIKLFDENYSTVDILNEALNLAKVAETGLKTPMVNEVTKIDNKWAIVTNYQEGDTLQSLMEKNPDKLEEYINLFVDIQLNVQSKSAPLLTKLKDKMQLKINQSGLNATIRYELSTRLESMPKHTKLCHGDFNPSNVLISADGSYFILDWAHATQGNASADVARTYLLFCLAGQTDVAEMYLNTFCKKSDTAKQYVQKWLPIVAASQLVKGKPEEKEFLLHWIDVVEYE